MLRGVLGAERRGRVRAVVIEDDPRVLVELDDLIVIGLAVVGKRQIISRQIYPANVGL